MANESETGAARTPPANPSLCAIAVALLSRRQVADRCNVCIETIKRWEKRGLLPAIKINARVTRYEPDVVDRLIRNARVGVAA